MANVKEAREILRALGLPPHQQNEMSALTLMALCALTPNDSWRKARRQNLTITKGVMTFIAKEFDKQYAPNTRETFRWQVLHQFVQARIADYNPQQPDLPTNSPRAHYAITEAALAAVRAYGTPRWKSAAKMFLANQGSLASVYEKKRSVRLVPVRLPNGTVLKLSPGKHNKVQAAVIEEFAPRFAPGANLLYMGDTARNNLHVSAEHLAALGINVTDHDKLPDLILYSPVNNRVFLIEVVTSHGPMTPKRTVELTSMFGGSKAGLVFVSAFPDFAEFRKHIREIAWETEVWVAEVPDHLIHFNGDHLLFPK